MVWLAFVALATAGRSVQAVPLQVYLVAGQSNAVGGANVRDLPPEEAALKNPQASIYQYLLGDAETTDWEALAARPGGGINAYFGPELAFAQAMERRSGQPIAVIKTAFNGTSLAASWLPSKNDLYQLSLAKIQSALAQLDEPYEIAGMLWIQGEGDSNILARAEAYDENLLTLAAAFREDLDAPNMALVYNEAHVDLNRTYVDQLRISQRQAAVGGDNFHIVNADDLELKVDWVHFTTPMMVELGRRFADVLLPSGDFNDDGIVDGADLTNWKTSFGLDRRGDGNADGIADGADFLLWQRQVGSAAVQPTVQPIPEPKAVALAACCAAGGFSLAIAHGGRRRLAANS